MFLGYLQVDQLLDDDLTKLLLDVPKDIMFR